MCHASHPPDICPEDAPMKCSGTYEVNQADMDRGFVGNTFAVSASSPDEENVGGSTSESVALPGNPVVTIGEPPSRKL